MSLLSAIATASTALHLFSSALGNNQTNVSNSATPGFAAFRADVPAVGSTAGSVSDSVQVTSTGELQADALVQAATSQASHSRSTTSQLDSVNQLFDITGASGILSAFNQFSTAFANLALTPNDALQRSAALSAADGVALAFRRVSSSLDALRVSTDSGILSTVDQINHLASQIRQFNIAIRGQTQPDPGTDSGLRAALEQLAVLTDITVTKNQDGTSSVLTGGQQPLVIEDQTYQLSARPSAPPGSQVSSSGGGGSPVAYGGQLGALLNFRNGALQGLQGGNGETGALNDLAAGFASRVNAVLSVGVTADGTRGHPLFTYDNTNGQNAARTLARDPSISSDLLALSTTGSSAQVNGVAVTLAGLSSSFQPADQIGGLSAHDLFASIAANIGQQLSDARAQSATDQTALTSAHANRQQVSGVSLDTEAVSITAYQRSYEASAKLISILDQLTSDAVNLIK